MKSIRNIFVYFFVNSNLTMKNNNKHHFISFLMRRPKAVTWTLKWLAFLLHPNL